MIKYNQENRLDLLKLIKNAPVKQKFKATEFLAEIVNNLKERVNLLSPIFF